MAWRKSSYSAANGECVEVGAWRKSSRSESGNCVEVAAEQAAVAIRDSKNPDGIILMVPAAAFAAFTLTLRG